MSVFTLPTIADHKTNHPPVGGPGGGSSGEESGCSYPAFSDKPSEKLVGDAANFTTQYGDVVDSLTESAPVFNENGNFSENWFFETMVDSQHRVGNYGIDENGNAIAGRPSGKRYSAWYTHTSLATSDTSLTANDGITLALGGVETNETDPTRVGTEWALSKLYTTWLSTFQRPEGIFGEAKDGSVSFSPPMYLEARVNFEQMKTPGFRLSMWMMPVEKNTEADQKAVPSIAYDDDFKNGFELDIFEFEPISVTADGEVCGNTIEFSWIRGFHTGKGRAPADLDGKNHFEGPEEGYCTDQNCDLNFSDPNGQKDDINVGWHTVGLLWTESAIAWSFNNELVLEITDSAMIPDREHYLIISREMTNGLSQEIKQTDQNGDWAVFLPAETGLYGWNGNSNVGEYSGGDFTGYINTDKALIDSVTIWGTKNIY